MKVRIINSKQSEKALLKANVPTFIVPDLLNKVVDYDGAGNISFKWKDAMTTWSVPSECLETISSS